MKKTIFTIVLLILSSFFGRADAQELSPSTQAVYDACLLMRSAINSGNAPGLRMASAALKKCNPKPFKSLRPVVRDSLSLNGHFVFDYEFADSLIAGREVYKFAQRYADRSILRGVSSKKDLCVLYKTCIVRGNASAAFTFTAKGPQELAVVAEPGGLVTLRIHDKTHDVWYNDNKKVKDGLPSRFKVLDLPYTERCTIELEVINTSPNDISFVVISN